MSGAEILLEPGVIPRLLQGLWVTVDSGQHTMKYMKKIVP